MKKHAKIVFKEFGSSFGRFMAIAGIIALGLAFLIGINQTTPDLKASFTNFFTENSLYDFSVRGAFSAEDVEEMAAVEGVNETEALISYDAYATAEDSSKERTVRFYGMDDLAAADDENALNRLTIVDGEMPDSPDEVVAIKPFGNMESVAVGDKLTVKPKGMTETMMFAETELTVSAIATSPIYFSNNDEICSIGDGNIDFIVFTSSDVFNTRLMEMGGSRYTEVWATAAGADELTAFTDEYDDLVAGVKEDLEALADAHAPAEGDATGTAWYVLDRSTNLSYYSLSINADKVANLAGVFPAFFIAVAALVAFSTIVRMVNEDRLQIGTLRSLGYAGPRIVGKYIFYSVSACVLGLIAGVPLGLTILPLVLWNAYGTMYALPTFLFTANWLMISVTSVLSVIATVFVTACACWSSLRETPAALLQPRAPKPGKRILLERIKPIWNPMPFKYKATFRNIFRFKRNLILTVLSVAGCTALILCSFGLLNSTAAVTDLQFNGIYDFDLTIGVTQDYKESADLTEFLDGKRTLEVLKESGSAIAGDKSQNINIVSASDELNDFIDLGGKFGQDSVLLSNGLADYLGVKAGDVVIIRNANGDDGRFTVTDIVTMYSECWMFAGRDAYDAVFGEGASTFNSLLVDSGVAEDAQSEVTEMLLADQDHVDSVSFTSSEKELFDNLSETISLITVVLIACAGALVIIVLYNLTNINIGERKKEIATLKVLGYRRREIAGYVFREIIMLVAIGILIGLGLGFGLTWFVLASVEAPYLLFPRVIYWWSYIATAAITLAFSGLVDLILLPKLNKINMADSMKAVY